jgi:truncated hemoglobin YjbI
MQEVEVYSMIGTEGFTRLVAAFYRQVPQDDLRKRPKRTVLLSVHE